MATDVEIINWLTELGMKVEQEKSNVYFQINISPPLGGPTVAIIRPQPNSKYYIITTSVEIADNIDKSKLKEIMLDLMRMNVEFYLTPQDKPKEINIAKLVFSDLTKNELLETILRVKNSAYLVFTYLYNT